MAPVLLALILFAVSLTIYLILTLAAKYNYNRKRLEAIAKNFNCAPRVDNVLGHVVVLKNQSPWTALFFGYDYFGNLK